MMMPALDDLLSLEFFHPGANLASPIHSRAHGHRIDEQSDHLLDPWNVRLAAGHHRAKYHVVLSAVTVEQKCPYALKDCAQSDSMVFGHFLQRSGLLGG